MVKATARSHPARSRSPTTSIWLHGRMAVGAWTDDASVVLTTDRLLLRRLSIEDLDALAAIYADPEVRRFFPEGTLTREETQEEIAWMLEVDYPKYGSACGRWFSARPARSIGRCGLLPWPVAISDRAVLGLDPPEERPTPGSPLRGRGGLSPRKGALGSRTRD